MTDILKQKRIFEYRRKEGVEARIIPNEFEAFRLQLLSDLRQLFAASETKPKRQWLKNGDVRKLLNVSSNTVQRLRVSGKLKSSKIGGVHYYRLQDVEKLLESGLEN